MQSPFGITGDCFVAKSAPRNDSLVAFSDRHYLVSLRKEQDLSLRGAFCRSNPPLVSLEIASSHKTLLAMTAQNVFSDKHYFVRLQLFSKMNALLMSF